MKYYLLSLLLTCSVASLAQSGPDEQAIRQLLHEQTLDWNKGDVRAFMKGYWQNDSLLFIGKNGVTYGWENTLRNYQKNYPDTAAMGQLSFDLLLVRQISPDYFYVVGKWMLARKAGHLSGHYNLLIRKINGRWLIVADHSS